MSMATIIIIGLGVLTVEQLAWLAVYGTGPWRDTRFGWVWLFKGAGLALVWALLLTSQLHHLPDLVWVVLLAVMIAATSTWLWTTIQARRGRLTL